MGQIPESSKSKILEKDSSVCRHDTECKIRIGWSQMAKSESHARKHSVARSRGTYPCCCLWFLHSHAAFLKLTR